MKFVILSEKDNPFMKRKETSIVVEHIAGATPSKAGLQQALAKEWKAQTEQVDIKSIFSSVGRQQSRVKVFMWNSAKVADLSKLPKEGEKKEEAAPAAAPAPSA